MANRRAVRVWMLAAAVVATSGTLVGCGDGDAVTDAVREARLELVTLRESGSAQDTPLDEVRAGVYERVAGDLERALASADGESVDSARVLIAVAKAGRAAIEASRAGDARAEVRRALGRAAGVMDGAETLEWSLRDLGTLDAERERQRLRGELSELEDEVADAEEAVSDAEEALRAKRAEIDAQLARAREARLEENELRERALRLDGLERAELIEDAVEARRRAEGFELRAEQLRLDERGLERALEDAERRLRGAERRRDGVERLIDEVNEADSARDEAVVETRDELEAYRSSLSDLLAEARRTYEESFLPAFTDAERLYEEAGRAARSAGGVREQSGAVGAWSSQAAAGLALGHAELLSDMASTLERAGEAGDAAAFRERASELVEQAASQLENATGSGRGEDAQRAQDLMRARISALRDGGLDAEPVDPESGTGDGGMSSDG